MSVAKKSAALAGLVLIATLTIFQNCAQPNQIAAQDQYSKSTDLTLSPTAITLAINSQQTFAVAGGKPPFVYSAVGNCGAMDVALGVYTSPAQTGSCQVSVQDLTGAVATATVSVVPAALAVTFAPTLPTESSAVTFMVNGGTAPYTYAATYTATTSSATFTGNVLSTPSTAGTVNITITDTNQLTYNVSLSIPAATPTGTYTTKCHQPTITTNPNILSLGYCETSSDLYPGPLTIDYGKCPGSVVNFTSGNLACATALPH